LQKRALEGIPHIAFTLVCGAKLKSALWRIGANVKFVIRKKDGDRFVERNYPSNEFTFAAKTLADMVPWEEIDTTLGCSVSDPKTPIAFTIELHIDIVKSYGFRRRARFEYSFFEPSIETDMVLIIENKEIYVNATYLSMLSPFFRSLQTSSNVALYGEIPTEVIPDVSAEDFLELLSVVYPSQKPVTVENVEMLLRLGDRYSFECVLVKCENFLITNKADEIDVFTRLEWASKYAMADLQVGTTSYIPCCENKESFDVQFQFRFMPCNRFSCKTVQVLENIFNYTVVSEDKSRPKALSIVAIN
uniref:BTB domain-containing protein n=1 Tax=Haemonchus placei TaxID=6290 RepID=A0A0N4WGZ7_HAEPC